MKSGAYTTFFTYRISYPSFLAVANVCTWVYNIHIHDFPISIQIHLRRNAIMMTCPKCGETFYIMSDHCPKCNAEISAADRKKNEELEAAQAEERFQARLEMCRKNRPRFYFGSGFGIALCVFFLGMAFAAPSWLWIIAAILSFLLTVGVVIFFGFVKQGAFCPYCGEWMLANRHHPLDCPWCNKSLMD